MWSDLQLIVQFLLNCLSGIVDVVTSTVLVLGLGVSVLALIIKIFKRIL